ncbi:MAG: hypothetical protein M0006_07785 [Magnetospirillum sp.]|nr:hypothetical protein [Magnetospirillum sp.]
MTTATLGLLLVWSGAGLVGGVLIHRVRRGAWRTSFVEPPPSAASWVKVAMVFALALAAAGTGVLLRGMS